MKKDVWIFGGVLGIILAGGMVVMVSHIYNNPDLESNDPLGYAIMVVIFSLVFFGVRNYRNKQLGGMISLGRAFKAGALMALVGSAIYVVAWLFYYYLFVPDFLDKYIQLVLNDATRGGATEAELAAKTEQMEQFREWYKNPAFVILITFSEVLPIGIVVAFVSSLILRKMPEAENESGQPGKKELAGGER